MIVHKYETLIIAVGLVKKQQHVKCEKIRRISPVYHCFVYIYIYIYIQNSIYIYGITYIYIYTKIYIYIYINNSLCLAWKYSGIFVHRHYLTKTVSFEEQIMSKDNYMSMFLCKIEAIVFIILQIFCNVSEKNVCKQLSVCSIRFLFLSVLSYDLTNKYIFPLLL